MQLLKLTHNCLNFDFIGTSTDESSDDLCTVQIPTSWRSGNLAGGRGLIYSILAESMGLLLKPSLYLTNKLLHTMLDVESSLFLV